VLGEPGRAGYEIMVDGVFNAIAIDARRPPNAERPAEEPPAGGHPKPEAEPTPAASPSPDRG
jgi:hypothetical protein